MAVIEQGRPKLALLFGVLALLRRLSFGVLALLWRLRGPPSDRWSCPCRFVGFLTGPVDTGCLAAEPDAQAIELLRVTPLPFDRCLLVRPPCW